MKYLTGKDYPWVCTNCRSMIDAAVLLITEGPDTDDEEAPANFVYDHGLYCGKYNCEAKMEFTLHEKRD